jgi:PAS domain S-box-containing protein
MLCEQKIDILLVDDHVENLLALGAILESPSYNLVKALSGEEALKCILSHDFAVILMDVQMPGMDGFETAAIIRDRKRTRHTPIIFLTAIDKSQNRVVTGYELGAVDYLFKPVVPEILQSKVEVLVDIFRKTEEIKRQAAQLAVANQQLAEEIIQRKEAEKALQKAHDELEIRVQKRTAELTKANEELRTEIISRQQAESDVKASEERFRATFNQAAVGIAHVGIDGKWLLVNQKLCDIVGYTQQELQSQTFQAITHPDDLNTDLEYLRRILANEIQTYSMEKRYIRKNGDYVWINLTVSVVRQSLGEPKYLIAVVEDICERQLVQSALRQSEQRYRFLADAMPQIVWTAQPNNAVDYYNQRWYDYTGMTFNATQNWQWQSVLHPEDQERCLEGWEKAVQTGSSYQIESRFKRAIDGAYRWHLGRALPMKDSEGKIILWVGTFTDIDDQKRTQEQLLLSLQEKEVLLKEIHHRVKNNMQIISSLLNLQSEYIQDQQYLEFFKVSQNRIESMALIHEKLYQSKDLARIDFAEYIQDLVDSLFGSYKFDSSIITLKLNLKQIFLDVEPAIPCGLIINELVLNCFNHAFPAGHSGEISIEFYLDNENTYMLIVSDNGIGFPPNFDFRNTSSLGLQLVNALTNQLGGTIELNTSSVTEFKITFPVEQ